MYVLIGTTRGDELIQPTQRAMFAAPCREDVEAELARVKQERDAWLAEYEHTVLPWQRCALYSRFYIEEVPGP